VLGHREGESATGRAEEVQHGIENVSLAPKGALGHTGGAAGVEDVEIIVRRLGVERVGRGYGQGRLIVECPGEQRVPGTVIHLEEQWWAT
jgi:hypothetical protein